MITQSNQDVMCMSEDLNFLREDEKVLAQGGVVGARRANILASLNQLAVTLDLSTDATQQLIEGARTKFETLSPKEIKKIGKKTVGTAQLISELLATARGEQGHATEPLTNSTDQQIEPTLTVEVAAETEELSTGTDQDVTELAGEADVQVLPVSQGDKQYIQSIVGPIDDLELTSNDITAIIDGLLELRGEIKINLRSVNIRSLLEARFKNTSVVEMAEMFGKKVPNIHTTFWQLSNNIKKLHSQDEANKLFRHRIIASRLLGEDTPQAPNQEAQPEVEDAPEIPEPTYLSVGNAWAERLDLNRQLQSALKEFLNPLAGVMLNKQKRESVDALIQYISQYYETIDNEILGLSVSQKLVLRHMMGAWYKKTSGDSAERPINTMAFVLKRLRNAKPAETIISDAMTALQQILDIDEERLTRPDATPEQREPQVVDAEAGLGMDTITAPLVEPIVLKPTPKPPVAALKFVKKEAPVSTEETIPTREEWLAHTEVSLVQVLTEYGITTENAQALWQRFHFDEAGEYRQDTPAQRAAMADLQNLLVKTDLQKLQDLPHALVGIKMLSTAAMGYKTLDDVLRKAQEKNPELSKEQLERDLIDNIGRMVV